MNCHVCFADFHEIQKCRVCSFQVCFICFAELWNIEYKKKSKENMKVKLPMFFNCCVCNNTFKPTFICMCSKQYKSLSRFHMHKVSKTHMNYYKLI